MKKTEYLPIAELMEAFETFTKARVVNELERLTRKNKHPRSYLNQRVENAICYMRKKGKVELNGEIEGTRTYRWVRSGRIKVTRELPMAERMPSTILPPIDLDDHMTKASEYWANAARNAK